VKRNLLVTVTMTLEEAKAYDYAAGMAADDPDDVFTSPVDIAAYYRATAKMTRQIQKSNRQNKPEK
jgi:hypothetical protein